MTAAKQANNRDRPDVIAMPPFILLTCVVLGWLSHALHPLQVMNSRSSHALGAVLALAAVILGGWARLIMAKAGTSVRPDRPSTTIVRAGPYRVTRNPMYVSFCLLQLALGLALNDWIPLLLALPLALVLHFGVILREERYLEFKFGEQYLALKRSVRRWV
jgi:protein-S-isoprenylcysteine O-methyltransferase Ste14